MSRRYRNRGRTTDKPVVYRDTWESLTDMVRSARGWDSSWHGLRQSELVHEMETGISPIRKEAESMFDKFMDLILPGQEDFAVERDTFPTGATPCIPAYLACRPDSMWRDVAEEAKSLVRIYVNMTCSCSISAETMTKRGIAIAAMAYALQTTRPVELFWFTQSSNSQTDQLSVYRVGTAPLDMSRVATIFGRVGIARASWSRSGKCFGGWDRIPTSEILEIQKDDVVIPAVMFDQANKVEKDPVAWIMSYIEDQIGAREVGGDRYDRALAKHGREF